LELVVASLLVLASAVGWLPWWDAGFPFLIAWLCLTNVAMHWLDRRAEAD
jgi:hypothetical protein